MKIVDREELMRLPPGTIYRAYEPCCWQGDWMRLHSVCSPDADGKLIDWYESTIGPDFAEVGHYRTIGLPPELKALLTPDKDQNHFFEMSDDYCREACFDPKLRYLVLEENDIKAMIEQLTGGLKNYGRSYCPMPPI